MCLVVRTHALHERLAGFFALSAVVETAVGREDALLETELYATYQRDVTTSCDLYARRFRRSPCDGAGPNR